MTETIVYLSNYEVQNSVDFPYHCKNFIQTHEFEKLFWKIVYAL